MDLTLQLPDRPSADRLRICQGDWLADDVFVGALCDSWTSQYQDYIGKAEAASLIHRLHNNGDLYAHDPKLTIVAKIDKQHVGIAAIRPVTPFALITMLEVLPEYQRSGIGQLLVQVLTSAGKRLVAHVSIHRPVAVAFYRSMRFAQLPRIVVDHYGHKLEFEVMVSEPYRPADNRFLYSGS